MADATVLKSKGSRFTAATVVAPGVEARSSWQLVADAIAGAQRLSTDIPGFEGFDLAPETDLDLRAAAVLLQRAVKYLHAAAVREAPRLEAIEAGYDARGELPPWHRQATRLTEEGD